MNREHTASACGGTLRNRVLGLLVLVAAALVAAVTLPANAMAADGEAADAEVEISADGEAARLEGCTFAVEGFYHAPRREKKWKRKF